MVHADVVDAGIVGAGIVGAGIVDAGIVGAEIVDASIVPSWHSRKQRTRLPLELLLKGDFPADDCAGWGFLWHLDRLGFEEGCGAHTFVRLSLPP